MTTPLASRLAATALRLVEQYGAPLTLKRRGGGGYNPTTDEVVITQTSETGTGVLGAWSPQEIAAGLAEAPDVRLTVAAAGLSAEPAQGDEIEIAGRKLLVAAPATRLYVNGTVVAWELRARG